MLSSNPACCANREIGSSPATTGSILVDRKKNSTSVHLRTGRIDNAYAAGIASSSTTTVEATLGLSELPSAGHGVVPAPAPRNSRYPCNVSGAASDGGLVAASGSECSEVSSIQSTGSTKTMPTSQATNVRTSPPRL